MVWVKCQEYRLHGQHDVPDAYDMHQEHHVAHAYYVYAVLCPVPILGVVVLNEMDSRCLLQIRQLTNFL